MLMTAIIRVATFRVIQDGITCSCRFLTDVLVVRNLNKMVIGDAAVEFSTSFPDLS